MRSLVLLLLLIPAIGGAATQLYYEDFETAGWEARGAWTGISASGKDFCGVVDNNPHTGTYALRWNIQGSRDEDPILGPGYWCYSGPTAECYFGDVSTTTDDTLFVRYWGRADDVDWVGSFGTTGFQGKWAYITEETDGVLSLYGIPGTQDRPEKHWLGSNDGTNCMTIQWIIDNWPDGGSQSEALTDIGSPGFKTDGTWHKYEFLVDYINNTIEFWFDDVQATNEWHPDGTYPVAPCWKVRGINPWHSNGNRNDLTVDGPPGEYACGMQIDDIEAWDGWPDDTPIPPPQGDPPIAPVDTVWVEDGGG